MMNNNLYTLTARIYKFKDLNQTENKFKFEKTYKVDGFGGLYYKSDSPRFPEIESLEFKCYDLSSDFTNISCEELKECIPMSYFDVDLVGTLIDNKNLGNARFYDPKKYSFQDVIEKENKLLSDYICSYFNITPEDFKSNPLHFDKGFNMMSNGFKFTRSYIYMKNCSTNEMMSTEEQEDLNFITLPFDPSFHLYEMAVPKEEFEKIQNFLNGQN